MFFRNLLFQAYNQSELSKRVEIPSSGRSPYLDHTNNNNNKKKTAR